MEQNQSSLWKGYALQVKKGGTYELSYTVSIPPSCALETDFFLRCNTAILNQTIRHIRKQSGYRLTVLEHGEYDLEDNTKLVVDMLPSTHLENLSSPICCSISAKKLM